MSMNSAKTSDLLTTSTQVATGKNYLKGVKIITNGTADATVTIYDTATGTATGKVVYMGVVPGANHSLPVDDFSHMVQAELGLYVVISGKIGRAHV